MRRTRHVIAVMVVATAALCADRATAATPAHHDRAPSRSFATKLTSCFRQSVASSVRMIPVRTNERAQSFPLPIRDAASGVRSEFAPFQFRLPPPAL